MAHVHPSFPPAPVPHQPSPLGFGFAFPRGSHYAPTASSPGGTPPSAPGGGGSFGSPLRRNGPSFASPSFPVAQANQHGGAGGVSSFGFGFGGDGGSPAGPSSSSGSPGGALGRPTASFHRHPSSAAGTPPPSSGPSRRRGRDDLSDSSGDEVDEDGRPNGGQRRAPARPMRGMKRSKTDDVFGPSAGTSSGKSNGQGQASEQGGASDRSHATDEPDLGVLLALLPPTSLLPILTSLVQRHPQLKPDLLALLPQPSLAVALDALRAAESRIRSAVPFGWDAQRPGGSVSEHYVVGRVQESVGELASLVQSHLPIFLPSSSVSAPSATAARPPPHPTDQFSYLQQTTALLIRLSTSLPHLAAVDILWARLAREWVRWAETVARWVNAEGGMVGAGVADGWVRELDLLAAAPADDGVTGASAAAGNGHGHGLGSAIKPAGGAGSAAKIRAEMGLVRDKWVRECGWLVGRRLQAQHVDVGMEEEEL